MYLKRNPNVGVWSVRTSVPCNYLGIPSLSIIHSPWRKWFMDQIGLSLGFLNCIFLEYSYTDLLICHVGSFHTSG